MKIFLHNYTLSISKAMRIAGYVKREEKQDFIREEQGGRFHAVRIASQVIEIHFDLYVDWKHVAFDMPMKHAKEKKRILRKLFPFKQYEMTFEKMAQLRDKYDL